MSLQRMDPAEARTGNPSMRRSYKFNGEGHAIARISAVLDQACHNRSQPCPMEGVCRPLVRVICTEGVGEITLSANKSDNPSCPIPKNSDNSLRIDTERDVDPSNYTGLTILLSERFKKI